MVLKNSNPRPRNFVLRSWNSSRLSAKSPFKWIRSRFPRINPGRPGHRQSPSDGQSPAPFLQLHPKGRILPVRSGSSGGAQLRQKSRRRTSRTFEPFRSSTVPLQHRIPLTARFARRNLGSCHPIVFPTDWVSCQAWLSAVEAFQRTLEPAGHGFWAADLG